MKRELVEHAESLAREEWGDDALKPLAPHLRALASETAALDYSGEEGAPWFVVETDAKCEATVAERMMDRHFAPYAPMCIEIVSHGRGQKRSEKRAFFRGYIFARNSGRDDQCQKMKAVKGVRGILLPA